MAFGPSALRRSRRSPCRFVPARPTLVAKALASSDAHIAKESTVTEAELDEARALLGENGDGVVFIVGRPNIAEAPAVMETAIRTSAERFPHATFLPALRRSNVMGALDMGLGPRLRPGRGYDASCEGRDTLAQLEAMRSGEQTAVLLLGGCLLGNVLDVDAARRSARRRRRSSWSPVTVARRSPTPTSCCPPRSQHERDGTVTNIEGRVTAVTPKIVAPGSAWPDVAIASELAEEFGQSLGLDVGGTGRQDDRRDDRLPGALGVERRRRARVPSSVERRAASTRRPLDPMAFPGHQVDRDRRPRRELSGATRRTVGHGRDVRDRVATLADVAEGEASRSATTTPTVLRSSLAPSLRPRHRRAGLARAREPRRAHDRPASITSTSTAWAS